MSEEYVRYANGRVGQVDGMRFPRYAGFPTFARLPRREDVPDFDIVVLGIPFDAGVTYRPGARFGPSAIRAASRLLRPYNPAQEISPFEEAQVVDAGDVVANPFNITEALDAISAAATELIGPGRPLVALGGDHTISLPLLRALHGAHGPIALVHFDAHLDTWDTYFGAPCTHGTPFRRASEEGLVAKGHSAHVGIRGPLYDRRDLLDDAELGFTCIHTRDLDAIGVPGVVDRIRARVGELPVHVSIDIDVLDPAFAPGTGTPEAGGLTSRELLAILRGMTDLRLVGADIVEVAPAYDHAEVTAVAAAHLAYDLISLLAVRA